MKSELDESDKRGTAFFFFFVDLKSKRFKAYPVAFSVVRVNKKDLFIISRDDEEIVVEVKRGSGMRPDVISQE